MPIIYLKNRQIPANLREQKSRPSRVACRTKKRPATQLQAYLCTIMNTISTVEEMQARHNSGTSFLLLDVRLPEDHEEGHIPGSVNQCVFEVAFLPELEKRSIDRSTAIVVYGAGVDSGEARMAAEKLERAGYTQVSEFTGGMDAWTQAGLSTTVNTPSAPELKVKDGQQALDLTESRVVWVGRNLINRHWGQVALKSGHVAFQNGAAASGEVILDLHRILCSDLAGSELHDVLIHHLESDDFFDVERFPEARFAFTRVEVCADPPGCRNLRLHGELTLRGQTHPLTVEATAGFTPEGKAALQATFTIDRTLWGVDYGSGKLFRRLAGHLVNDEIELQVRMITADVVRS